MSASDLNMLSELFTQFTAALEPDNDAYAANNDSTLNFTSILDGTSCVDINHAGGKFLELLAIEDDLFGSQ